MATIKRTLSRIQSEFGVRLELTIAPLEQTKGKRTIDLEPCVYPAFRLAIVGDIAYYRPRGTCIGQVHKEVSELLPNDPTIQRICEIWKRWHLNDMRAGTRRQTEAIEAYKQANPDWRYEFGESCEILKGLGLYEDRGYKYGSAWLIEMLPVEVGQEIVKLFS